jgi:hypothetical protein
MEETGRSTEAWRMLGFVHQLLKSSAENAALHTDMNVNNYHCQLQVMLKGIVDLQHGLDDRLKNVTITVDDHTFTCEVVCSIICVITDTPADTLPVVTVMHCRPSLHVLISPVIRRMTTWIIMTVRVCLLMLVTCLRYCTAVPKPRCNIIR